MERDWWSGFLQDEFALIPDRLHLAAGIKVEHNDYTGWEIQPSGRVTWRVRPGQTLWGAVSRAVRTPSRLDRELFAPGQPPYLLNGGTNFKSEIVIAYELGWRMQVREALALSLATFYNSYDRLRSYEQVSPPAPLPIVVGNGQQGHSYGAELTAETRVTRWWRLRGGYTELRVVVTPASWSTDPTEGRNESHDPERQFLLRSSLDLPARIQMDAGLRVIGRIEHLDLPAYTELDARIGWQPYPKLELAVVGQNLLHGRHTEYGTPTARREIERSVYGSLAWRF